MSEGGIANCRIFFDVIQLRWLNEAWPMGAKMLLVVAQANEANNATDEMPAKDVPLRA